LRPLQRAQEYAPQTQALSQLRWNHWFLPGADNLARGQNTNEFS
jgi:hypothetical protein